MNERSISTSGSVTYLPGDGIWKRALPASGAVLDVTRRGERKNCAGTEERDHPRCHCHVLIRGLSLSGLFLLLRLVCVHRSFHIYTERQSLLPLDTPSSYIVTLSSCGGASVLTIDNSTHSINRHFLKDKQHKHKKIPTYSFHS